MLHSALLTLHPDCMKRGVMAMLNALAKRLGVVFALRSEGGFEAGFNLGSNFPFLLLEIEPGNSTWVRSFGRVRVVPGFRTQY